MAMVMRSFKPKDLKYYYFYYRIGCKDKNCAKCHVRQETEIFYHLFDGGILAKAEKILRREINKLRFHNYEHAERVVAGAVHYFDPQTHKAGKVVKSWKRENLEQLLPVKRQSMMVWYYVFGTVSYPNEAGVWTDHEFRSKSFPAASPQSAVEKSRQWLEDFEKGMKKKQPICKYEACIHYANANRGIFSLPGTNGSILRRFTEV